ncbi:MAG: hypothetical protein ACOYVF_12930 [Candidatus Zixiibacteriota bacterium]
MELVRTGRFSLVFEKRDGLAAATLSSLSHVGDSLVLEKRGEAVFDTLGKAVYMKARDFLAGDSLLVDYDTGKLITLSRVAGTLEKKNDRLVFNPAARQSRNTTRLPTGWFWSRPTAPAGN